MPARAVPAIHRGFFEKDTAENGTRDKGHYGKRFK
jgi:hypothetical protein